MIIYRASPFFAMKKIIRFCDVLSSISGVTSAITICLGVALVLTEIVARSVFSKTLYVAEEYSGYLMCALTFLALGYTLREKAHIRMTFLRTALPERGKLILDMICYVVGFVFCVGLTYVTFRFFWDSFTTGSKSMQISETPLAIPQFFLPLGSVLLAVQFIGEFLKTYRALMLGNYQQIGEEAQDLGR